MIEIIEKYRATVCFTAPTAYRAMLRAMEEGADLSSSLRAAVSAGETLPGPVYDEWIAEDRQADARRNRGDRDAAYLSSPTGSTDHRPGLYRPAGDAATR